MMKFFKKLFAKKPPVVYVPSGNPLTFDVVEVHGGKVLFTNWPMRNAIGLQNGLRQATVLKVHKPDVKRVSDDNNN